MMRVLQENIQYTEKERYKKVKRRLRKLDDLETKQLYLSQMIADVEMAIGGLGLKSS